MDDRDDTGDSQAHEHEGTVGPPFWGTEVLEPGNDQAAQAQDTYLHQNDQADNPGIVELVSPFCHARRVITKGMIRSAHAQTQARTGEETPEDEPVRPRGAGIPRCNTGLEESVGQEPQGGEGDSAEEVGPDVDGLIVESEDAAE
ncbi:hypothetical protein VM1G_11560 [Cytospora mali]|uniref:Uncharacterized protein n=1 Tax=Cytospora mali TaxID=578113 RepID=A0A194VYR9_CYTMA|nr:hypothetical protein VM1G_11560 [Valsa mali]